MASATSPDFERPPVIEVVCGIQFEGLKKLTGLLLGSFWDKIRDDYPKSEERAPLAPIIERFDATESTPDVMRLSDVPPLPRYWFRREDDTGIVQVQRDRFLYNWKNTTGDPTRYPRYPKVIKAFREQLDGFETFLRDRDVGEIQPRQYEMTYVNYIPIGDGWNEVEEMGNMFRLLAWPNLEGEFLPSPEAILLRSQYCMKDDVGRLHALVTPAMAGDDQKQVLKFDLTARGMPKDDSRDAMWKWFDLAHEWIVRGFVDLTSDGAHKVWGRIHDQD